MIRRLFRGWGRPEGSLWRWRAFAICGLVLAVVGVTLGPRLLCLVGAAVLVVGLGFSPFDPSPEDGDDD